MDELHLNVSLLRTRVPNLTVAARSAGLRPATVSNLCTGKIPIGRAEVRTLALLASLAGCTMDELIVRGSLAGMIETGIKALDLLAPVIKGGRTGLVARPGTGQMVLLAELLHRLKKQGYTSIFWKPAEDAAGTGEVLQEADYVCRSAEEVLQKLHEIPGKEEIVLAADRSVVLSGEFDELMEGQDASNSRSITTILVDITGDAVDDETPYGPLDTFLRFDAELTTRGLFPAIDPVASTSVILEGAQLEPPHVWVQQQTRKLMRRYRELRPLVLFRGIDKLPESEKIMYRRGERLEAYLSQPFYIAEPYTGKKAEWIPLPETLEDVGKIVNGGADHIPVDELTFAGRIKDI